MRIPASTYRIQVNADFPLSRLQDLVSYFEALGVGDLYLSPVFEARPHSPHGYDVTNPNHINPEIGSREEFTVLSAGLHARNLGVLLDIVPNHMAASEQNPWWRDILEHGPASLAARFFDVEWEADGDRGQIVLPVLGRRRDEAIDARELQIAYINGELCVAYFDRSFPLDPTTYALVLRHVPGADEPLIAASEAIAPRTMFLVERKEIRRDAGLALKQRLREWAMQPGHATALEVTLPALPREIVADVLDAQAYQLEFWQSGVRRINYRRFFDITDLAGVRVEDPDVFAATHALILELIRTRQIDGVRVDHVDGLRDPGKYLDELRAAINDTYVVVEKILAPGERLRENWPVEGTTGYDFTGLLAGFFCNADGVARITEAYHARTGMPRFSELVYEKKKLVIDKLFAAELRSLTEVLTQLGSALEFSFDAATLRSAVTELSACLSVYRTYILHEITDYDRCLIKEALTAARHHETHIHESAFALLRKVLLDENIPEHVASRRANFVANWQQFTGPVMAKGIEDTAFYSYNPLLALSEVGAHPNAIVAAPEKFHEQLLQRAQRWPHTLNASSTHDTKRSEDARARIQVLSEMPDRWNEMVTRWLDRHGGAEAPDTNEKYLIYQTLLGFWPLHWEEEETVPERLQGLLQKSLREAKVHSSWIEPNQAYEQQVWQFTRNLLRDQEFLADFRAIHEDVAWYGALNSLAQLVIKLAAPGVPDIYQGNESWTFAVVDPDNRRPVNFQKLREHMSKLPAEITPALAAGLLQEWRNGRIKMHVTRSGLQLRREKPQLFAQGEYVPLPARGRWARNVVAFARRFEGQWAIAITGRFYSQIGRSPIATAWGDTSIELPTEAPRAWRNVITNEHGSSMGLEQVFNTLPFALLVPTD